MFKTLTTKLKDLYSSFKLANIIRSKHNTLTEDDLVAINILKELNKDNPKEIDWDSVPEPEIEDYGKEKNLLIVDDIKETLGLYSNDRRHMMEKYNYDLHDEYNIILCLGAKAGFIAEKIIRENKIHIDTAILDISLNCSVKLQSGTIVSITGISLAGELVDINPDVNIVIATVHNLDIKEPVILNYTAKYNLLTKRNIMDSYLNKNNTKRHEVLYSLLTGGVSCIE